MKKLVLVFIFFLPGLIAFACPVCEKQQPKILQGITHGAGPGSQWDYIIVWIGVIIVLATLFYSIKWLIKPGENSPAHIKQSILNAE
ncbi:MAG: hypothetical protein WKF68_04960 [Daejeonella sp.]